MKEVKFRIWDKKEKKMYYLCDTGGLYWNKTVLFIDFAAWEQKSSKKGSDVVKMQYITLKDKNNKRIYEEDIVKYDKVIGVVKWDDSEQGGARFYIKTFDWHSESYFDVCWKERWSALKIIGNIYENPELLIREEE